MKIVKKKAYRAVGLKWSGSWSEITELQDVIKRVRERSREIIHVAEQGVQLALSYHTRPDGFILFSGYEVSAEQEIPAGMTEFFVPELTYVVTTHIGGNITETYKTIARWIKDNGFTPYKEPNITYFDLLPIKHEKYLFEGGKQHPHYEIWIPIER